MQGLHDLVLDRLVVHHWPQPDRLTVHPCSKVDDPAARPPLCVTAAVEAIELRTKRIDLTEDMQVGSFGSGAWEFELIQGTAGSC